MSYSVIVNKIKTYENIALLSKVIKRDYLNWIIVHYEFSNLSDPMLDMTEYKCETKL